MKPTTLSASSTDQQTGFKGYNGFLNSQGSALKGASVAFQAPHPPPKPLVNTYSGTNGALAAATKAGLGQQRNKVNTVVATLEIQTPSTPRELLPTQTGDRYLRRAPSGTINTLKLSASSNTSRQQSPSHIAATLAAARSTPTPTPANNNIASTDGRGPHWIRGSSVLAQDRNDETSIPATNALVQLFESKYSSNAVEENGEVAPTVSGDRQAPRQIVSPTPVRPHLSLRLSSRTLNESTREAGNGNVRTQSTSNTKVTSASKPASAVQTASKPDNASAANLYPSADAQKMAPQLPPPRRTTRPHSIQVPSKQDAEHSTSPVEDGSSTSSYASARDSLSRMNALTQPSSRKSQKPQPTPTFTPQIPNPNKTLLRRRASARSYITTPNSLTPQLTTDSLANAMVASSIASSLASSRATSPHKPTPPLPRRHSRPYSLFAPAHLPTRTPSPSKTGMRHTLRKAHSGSSDEDERKQHHHILHKHPNKHAEGDRKRWRDSITERERKRYEGVWAANRGLLLPSECANEVHGLAVRDLWGRSLLSGTTLEGIWELVDGLRMGRLRREEFVVGMWLVDQCLKGRKLPVVVGESVWESVRVGGVRVKGGGGGVRGRP